MRNYQPAASSGAQLSFGISNSIHSDVYPYLPLPSVPVFCGALDQELKLFDESRSSNRSDVVSCAAKIADLLRYTDVSYLNLRTDGDQEPYNSVGYHLDIHNEVLRHNVEAFHCGTPGVLWRKSAYSLSPSSSFSGPSNEHINVVGLSESMPFAENLSTSVHVHNDSLGTQKQQHKREKSRRIMSDGSGSKQPRKKQKITTTTLARPTLPSPVHRIFEQSPDESSYEEEDESDDEESKVEEEEEANEEDEDEQQPPEENLKGQNPRKSDVNRKAGKNVPLAVTLTDQDVFDCPICFENLTNIVYQCENGHIACDSCCVKLNKICPTCSCPIGYRCRAIEKVLEAIQVPCVNAEHGCQQVISYCKKRDHEDLCLHLPCSCPIRKCDFKGTASNLYQHFAVKKHHAINFRFKYRFSVSVKREKNFLVLREKRLGTLFVLKLFTVPQGNVISIVLIGPKSTSGNYRYELAAKDDGETPPMAMQSQVESVPRLADYRPTRYFLVVEDGISQLDFDIRIRQNQ